MALNIKGKKCPVCTSYLFEEDDIVFCPICGAPHHRDCYKAVGHCALEELHGTEEQYNKKVEEELKKEESAKQHSSADSTNNKQKTICLKCKKELSDDMLVCPYCGMPRNARIFTFDHFGGINPKTDIGDGITADEAKDIIGANSHIFIPKFAKLTKQNKASFNWFAFFFPHAWFLSRKMYNIGAIITTILLASEICLLPVLRIMNSVVLANYSEYAAYIMENISSFGIMPIALMFASSILNLAVRIFSGIFGNYFYKRYVIKKCKELKTTKADKIPFCAKHGGVNFFAALIGIFIVLYAPNMILAFL